MRPGFFRALFVLALALPACRGEAPAQLVSAVDLTPREAEVGDRLEVIGAGFPEGKLATVSFRGDLFRPGQEPVRGAEIVAQAASTSQNKVSLLLTEALQTELCGRGESADHTTFRGDVVVAFAARTAGAPPVTGVLQNVVLDVQGPAVPSELAKAREAESRRALAFVGVQIDPTTLVPPFVVKAVAPGSRGERAGLLAGDTLLAVDGVSIRSANDFTFSSDRSATFLLGRGRLKEPIERSVDIQGFRQRAPRDLAVAGVLVGLVVMLFSLWLAPVAKTLGWLERRVASRLRSRVPTKRLSENRRQRLWSSVRASLADDIAPAGEPWLVRLLPYLSFLATSAGATTVAFGRPLVAPDVDFGIVAFASLTVLVVVALMNAGWHAKGRWSIGLGLKGAGAALLLQLPVMLAFGAVVLATGSVRFSDMVAAQGAAPWTWNAFKNPALFFALGLVLVASFPQARRPNTRLAEADLDEPAPRGGLMFYVEWGHLLIVSTLTAILFLGGWRLPVPHAAPGAIAWPALGALLLQVKCWAVAGGVVALRWALPRVHTDQMVGLVFRYGVPAALAVLAGSAAWAASRGSPVWRTIEPVLGYVLFGLALGATLKFARAVMGHVRAAQAPMHVNPWL